MPGDAIRMKQLPLPLGSPAQGYDNFIVGANAAAVAALQAPAAGNAAPVYLWGAAGVGKSHLLAARAHGAGALRCAAGRAAPWPWQEGSTLVVLDDCEAYDDTQQHAAFALFVEAAAAGVPVVAAGRLPPVDLPVREDLRTRLGWGLVFHVQPASDADARNALQREAHTRGMSLPDDVLDYLLTHFARDLGSLMGWLDALDRQSLSEKRLVSLALLKRMLAEPGPRAAAPHETAA